MGLRSGLERYVGRSAHKELARASASVFQSENRALQVQALITTFCLVRPTTAAHRSSSGRLVQRIGHRHVVVSQGAIPSILDERETTR